MKKLLYLFCTSLLVLTSCSNDNSTTPSPVFLPKTIKYTSPASSSVSYTYTKKITYNGNKIVSIDDSRGYKSVYTYTGNLITKVINTKLPADIMYSYEYTYEGTNIKTLIVTQYVGGFNKTKFVYYNNYDYTGYLTSIINSDGSEMSTNNKGGEDYFFENDNLAKIRLNYYNCILTYEYDTKNNPFQNIAGFNKWLYCAPYVDLDYNLSVNNVVKETNICFEGTPSVKTYTYEYNSNNYPIKIISSDLIEEYTY